MRLKKETLSTTMLATFAWGLVAHGYCYFNLLFSHDSLMVYQNDYRIQLTNGRFLHLLYWKLRGHIYAPALVGFLSLFYLGLAIWLILELLDIRKKGPVLALTGILTTNMTVILLNATFLHEADIYMLSLLFSVGAVYVSRILNGKIRGGVLIACSLALYQSFYQVAVFLFMILAVLDLLRGEKTEKVIRDGLRSVVMLIGGMLLYYGAFRIILKITGAGVSEYYNSMTRVGAFDSLGAVMKTVWGTYRYVFQWYLHPFGANSRFVGLVNALVLCFTLVSAAVVAMKRRIGSASVALLAVLFMLMPFGMNVIYFISNGLEHGLMIYSLFLLYPFCQCLADAVLELPEVSEKLTAWKAETWASRSVCVLVLLLVADNLIFGNQTYLKKDLEYRNTMSIMTRIVDRMEQVPGYTLGETPVMVIGYLPENPLSQDRQGLSDGGVGLTSNVGVTYYETIEWFFGNILAYPVELVNPEEAAELGIEQAIAAMPCYPAKDSCQMMEGCLVVKLSDLTE